MNRWSVAGVSPVMREDPTIHAFLIGFQMAFFQADWALRDPVSGLVPDFRTGLTTLGMIRSVLFTFVCFPDWFRTN